MHRAGKDPEDHSRLILFWFLTLVAHYHHPGAFSDISSAATPRPRTPHCHSYISILLVWEWDNNTHAFKIPQMVHTWKGKGRLDPALCFEGAEAVRSGSSWAASAGTHRGSPGGRINPRAEPADRLPSGVQAFRPTAKILLLKDVISESAITPRPTHNILHKRCPGN